MITVEAIHKEKCFIVSCDDDKKFSKVMKQKMSAIKTYDVCVTDDNGVYFTSCENKSISNLSSSRLVSTLFSTVPFFPLGIWQTVNGDQLVTI